MNTSFPKFNLSWLNDTDPAQFFDPINVDCMRVEQPVSPEHGESWVEMLRVDTGITLFHACHDLVSAPRGQLVPLLEAEGVYPEMTFSAQVVQGGILCHDEGSPAVRIVSSPGHDLFRHQNRWRARAFAEGGVITEMTSIVLGDSALVKLLGDSRAGQLIETLAFSQKQQAVVRPIPCYVTAPLLDAVSTQYCGQTRQLYAQSKALEYLAGLTVHVCNEEPMHQERRKADRRHRTRVLEVREYLVNLEGRLPTCNDLAAHFGLSARHLNNEFSAEYGKSMFAYITDLRLEQAHAALQEGSTPMKAIAARLGYSHVNHFITAFKRKFGHSPGKVRNQFSRPSATFGARPVSKEAHD